VTGDQPDPVHAAFAGLRPLMFSIAYRMLASVGDAEDVVQEAFLRYQRALAEGTEVESPKAFLAAVTTRLSIDHLRSARVRRESYVGEWLPEPIVSAWSPSTIPAADPANEAERGDSLSMAFLLLLERLNPVERAVFLLHDVFGYGYEEIAPIVERTEDNCRQLAVRARRHVGDHKPRFDASREQREQLAERMLAAMGEGDLDGLVSVLAADVVVYGDSGGVAPNWPQPISGRDKVTRLLLALGTQMHELGVSARAAEVNGQPGAVIVDAQGLLTNVFSFDIVDGQVQTIRSVINPDKLQHLGPLADLTELRLRGRRPGAG
jgi:RNA polymerase sigma-70 factor (ECF subfamily)